MCGILNAGGRFVMGLFSSSRSSTPGHGAARECKARQVNFTHSHDPSRKSLTFMTQDLHLLFV